MQSLWPDTTNSPALFFFTNRYNVDATNFRNLRTPRSVDIVGTRYPTMHGNIMAAESNAISWINIPIRA